VDSRISKFYRMSIDERLSLLRERGVIDEKILGQLASRKGMLSPDSADRMVENVVGVFGLPLAVAPNFLVNGKDYVVPMVVEEPSVIAAVSSAAAVIRQCGGFTVNSTEPILIGQIHLCDIENADDVVARLQAGKNKIVAAANALQPRLVERGGGVVDIELRKLTLDDGRRVVALHLLVDTRDAMGANTVNTMCEGIAAEVETIGGCKAKLKILSNLADRSLMTARARIVLDSLGKNAAAVRDGIVLANDLALADPYRAATHNKGIMNGMDAVAIATGNDWRALEAGAHAFAARDGAYRALTAWEIAENGDLEGRLQVPVRMGIVGGTLHSNPAAVVGLSIANVASSQELGELMAAVGLAQNFAALRALAGDGIQKGHMRLHARSVASAAGVPKRYFDRVVKAMVDSDDIKERRARELLLEFSSRRIVNAGKPRGSGRAAGKVILLGEHAVVYGQPALALPISDAIGVSVFDAESGSHLRIPDWGIDQSAASGEAIADGVMALLQFLVRKLGIQGTGLRIEVDASIPPAAGLGSSAALAVAIIRALSDAFDLGMADNSVNELAFECEKLAHGTPSGIDNTLAVYDRPIVFSNKGSGTFNELDIRDRVPLVIACSGTRGSTRVQVDGVRKRWQLNKNSYEGIFEQIGRTSLAGADALSSSDFVNLGSLMNICQGLLNALGVSTPVLEEMVDIARSNGALGAKLTGGGGGGCVIALCPGVEAQVSTAFSAAGFELIEGARFDGGGN